MRKFIRGCLALSFICLLSCGSHVGRVPERNNALVGKPSHNNPTKNESTLISDRSVLAKTEQEPIPVVDGPLSLQAAIAFAIDNNLNAAEKRLESDIQKEAVAGARLKMLPSLTIEGEFSERDSYDASYSDPLSEQGAQDYNYSRDKTTTQITTELSWNLLNFGIAYYQKRQAAEQYQIMEQRRRRVIQNLKFDVAKSFWQLAVAKESLELAEGAVNRLAQRERILQKQLDNRMASELEALETSAILSEMQMALSGLGNQFRRHKNKLAMLLGWPVDRDFDIAEVDLELEFEYAAVDTGPLETAALTQRPEMLERDLEERITRDEARTALIRALPKPTLFYRYAYNDDSHLYKNEWQEAGLRLSFDLLSAPLQMNERRQLAVKKAMKRTQRQSMAAAIITQLRLAVIDFEDAGEKYQLSKNIAVKRKLLMEARRRHAVSGTGTYEAVIKEDAKYLIAQLRRLSALAELMVAEQRILNSAGNDNIGSAVYLINGKSTDNKKASLSNESVELQSADRAEKRVSPARIENGPAMMPDGPAPVKAGFGYSAIGDGYDVIGAGLPYSLQLSSWQTLKKARKVRSNYIKKGLNVYIVKAYTSSMGIRWRIFEGCYRTRKEADMVREKKGLFKAIVMRTPFAIHVGNCATKKAMEQMVKKKTAWATRPMPCWDRTAAFRC